jgi:4-amino-4-deoxy-L-arabinose transferase-like glycosyltransferase
MGLSFYNDEASTFRRCIAGQHQRKGEEVRWRQVKWVETWFGDQNGNNSPPCSVLGRVCYDSWKRLSQAEDGAVCEPAVRLPQLIAGLGGLVFVWLVGRRIGGAGVGIAAALVLAIHPWHVRYSTEARGYGLLLLAVPAAFYFLARGLEDGRWRWWLGCGMAQGLCAWAFPGAVYFLAVFNVLALAVTARGRMGTRLLVGSACGGMVALQLMLPVAPQLLEAIKKIPSMKGAMPLSWWGNVGAGLLCGVRGADEDPGNPNNLALARLAGPHGWLWLLVIAGALLGLAGMVMLVRRGGAASVVALAGPGSVLLSWVASRAQGNFLHPWYELAALPGLALGAGAVLAAVARGPAIRALLLTVVAGPLAAALLAIDLRLMDTGKENLRGVADALRQPGALVATMYSDVDVYLPEVRFLAPGRAVQDLRALVARARSERRTLWFEGRTALLASVAPELRRELEEGGDFEGERVFCGLEEQQFTHEIFRLRDGP